MYAVGDVLKVLRVRTVKVGKETLTGPSVKVDDGVYHEVGRERSERIAANDASSENMTYRFLDPVLRNVVGRSKREGTILE